MNTISDESLYAKVKKGDSDAFDILYQRFEKRLFQFVYGYVQNQQEDEEVFHDVLVEVMTGRELQFDQATFGTWIFRVARNRALNQLRSRQRGQIAYEHATLPPSTSAPEALLETHYRSEIGVKSYTRAYIY